MYQQKRLNKKNNRPQKEARGRPEFNGIIIIHRVIGCNKTNSDLFSHQTKTKQTLDCVVCIGPDFFYSVNLHRA